MNVSFLPQPGVLFPYFLPLLILGFVVIRYGENFDCISMQPLQQQQQHQQLQQQTQQHLNGTFEQENNDLESRMFSEKKQERCNIFEGMWVYDEVSRPHYEEKKCPYIPQQMSCQAHGRPDLMYQHWRWQPHGCSIPNFNASHMLKTLQGKRMLFIGDSITRGQFYSMVCLLQQAIPNQVQSIKTFGSLLIFSIEEYKATIEFYWAPFLVESNCDDLNNHNAIKDRIIRPGSVEKHAKHWKGAHIIVFNSYMWWINTSVKTYKVLNGSFKGHMNDVKIMKKEDAYKLALRKMVKWLERNVNPKRTKVFFSNMSPVHQWSGGWGGARNGNCYNQTMPIDLEHYRGIKINQPIMQTIAMEFDKAKLPIILLNITQLSDYRKDAHASIYTKQWSKSSLEKTENPQDHADCMHWCLPGLQDTWNELLYAKLFFPQKWI